MEDKILKVVTQHHPVTIDQCKKLYDKLQSFDKVILTIELCLSFQNNIDDFIKYS